MRFTAQVTGTPMEIIGDSLTHREFICCTQCGVQLETTDRDVPVIEEFFLDHQHESHVQQSAATLEVA